MAAFSSDMITPAVEARFWAKVDRRKPDECWEWQGAIDQDGYGRFRFNEPVRAHRVALLMSQERQKDGVFSLHSCDNRKCCNPAHLRWGNNADNMQDRKARGGYALGSKKTGAKLTEALVVEIRKLRDGSLSDTALAARFGVSPSTIRRAASGKGWAHV